MSKTAHPPRRSVRRWLDGADILVPAEFQQFDLEAWPALLAPLALAAQALGRSTMNDDARWAVRSAMIAGPTYVQDAFQVCLALLKGQSR